MSADASSADALRLVVAVVDGRVLGVPDRRRCRRSGRRPGRRPRWPPGGRAGHRCGHRGRAVAGQPRPAPPVPWIVATGVGMGVGLLLGATVVGFRTSLADLAVMGALTGLVLGARPDGGATGPTRRRWWWAAAMPLLWALGWTVTTLAGIAVGRAVHHLRRQRCRHLLRPVRAAAVPAAAPRCERDGRPDPGRRPQ